MGTHRILATIKVAALASVFIFTACKEKSNTDTAAVKQVVPPAGGTNLAENKTVQEISEKILALSAESSAADIEKIIKDVGEKAQGDIIARAYYAAMKPLLILRGVIPRLRLLGEQSQVLQTTVLGLLYNLRYSIYTQPPHIQALVKYLITPVPGQIMFKKVGELQDWLAGDLQTEIVESLKVFDGLAQGNFPEFLFDRAIGFSVDKRMDSAERYKIFHKSYFATLMATLHFALATINYFVAYDVEDLLTLQNKLLQFSRLNQSYGGETKPGLLESGLENSKAIIKNFITPQTIFNGIQMVKAISNIYKLRPGGAQALESSWQHVVKGAELNSVAFAEAVKLEPTIQNNGGDAYLFNPKSSLVNRARSEAILNQVKLIFNPAKRTEKVVSPITGDSFEINAWALFDASKPGVADRKAMYPDKFKGGNAFISDAGGTDYVINYEMGQPTRWPDPTFGGFLPGATEGNIYQVLRNVALTPATACLMLAIPVPTNQSLLINLVPITVFNCYFL